jgi:hypothetical protein
MLGAAACREGVSPKGPAVDGRGVQQIPLVTAQIAEPPSAPPKAPRVGNLVDEERPHSFDGALANPGMATLRAVNEKEIWLALSVMEGRSYDAIVNLETGCVVETFEPSPAHTFASRFDGTSDEQVTRKLASDEGQAAIGAHLALLARFDLNEIAAVMVRGHSDGAAAVSADHRKVALATRGRIFLSVDGGRTFARADHDAGAVGATIEGLRFSPGDKYLLYGSYSQRPRRPATSEMAVLDTASPLPAAAVMVDTESYTPLQVWSPGGRLLFAHRTERCIHGIDPAAPAMKQVACIAGPKISKDHFFYPTMSPSGRMGMELQGDFQATRGIVFTLDDTSKPRVLKGAYELHNAHVGPDDEGRFAWENRYAILRIDSPSGVRDTRLDGSPLGFDLQGNVLLFQQPPLVRPHKPMTRMPPAKGTLEDTKCSLVKRVSPTAPPK